MAETTETGRAIKALEPLLEDLLYWISHDPPATASRVCAERRARVEALRHLISEARKVQRLRKEFLGSAPKGSTDKTASGYEWAQDDVIRILSAPDTEGGA